MLNDAICFKAVYIVCGYTDLRSRIDRLAALVETQTGNNPYVPDTLFLFCGRRTDRIKGLAWEGDGWLLLYKRLSGNCFQWLRSPKEVRSLTQQQFRWLMEGLTIVPKKSVRPVGRQNIWDDLSLYKICAKQRNLPGAATHLQMVCLLWENRFLPWFFGHICHSYPCFLFMYPERTL